MNRHHGILVCIAVIMTLLRPASGENVSAVTPAESDRIIAIAFSKGNALYKKYSGVESVRKETISEIDPETKKIKSVSEVTSKRKDFFYKEPEIEVITYKKDGKDLEPSKCRVMKAKPLYPVFDEHGHENYRISVAGIIQHNGIQCYRILVEPRKDTPRHFKGTMYATVKNMETIYIEGTMAKLEFPIKEFRIALNTIKIDDVPVAQSGKVHVRVNVPVFFPDTIIETTLTTLETKLIP